jgi:hypothetical protein
MAAREAELLPVPYFHVVFTLPSAIGDIAYHNKAVVYDLLLRTAAETMQTIAADPKHLGARIAITAVLHTWGSAMTHHPHVHMIVPGGGIALDGSRWIARRPQFFLPVRAHEFIRRFLIHVLPQGFHRIRHYGLLAGGAKADNLAHARKLLDAAAPAPEPEPADACADPATPDKPCPCCGSLMRIIEVFKAGEVPRHRPSPRCAAITIDTS